MFIERFIYRFLQKKRKFDVYFKQYAYFNEKVYFKKDK